MGDAPKEYFFYFKKRVDKIRISVMLFSVMGLMKSDYIDWLDAQDMSAPVEGSHDGFRVEADEDEGRYEDEGRDDFESPTHEDCGWFGYEGLCED